MRERLLLEERVLKLLCIELDSELVRTHPGSGEEHRVLDEVRRRRPSAVIGVDHQLKGLKSYGVKLKSGKTVGSNVSSVCVLTLRRPRNSWDRTWGMDGSLPCLIACHLSPLVGRGSAPEALITVRARAKTSAFVKLL